jgi:hypothetical protein
MQRRCSTTGTVISDRSSVAPILARRAGAVPSLINWKLKDSSTPHLIAPFLVIHESRIADDIKKERNFQEAELSTEELMPHGRSLYVSQTSWSAGHWRGTARTQVQCAGLRRPCMRTDTNRWQGFLLPKINWETWTIEHTSLCNVKWSSGD